jgi:hypothetical protein
LTTTSTTALVCCLVEDPGNDEPSVKRHRFGSSIARGANVVPAERLAFLVAPSGPTRRFDERGLLDAGVFYRRAPLETLTRPSLVGYVRRLVSPSQLLPLLHPLLLNPHCCHRQNALQSRRRIGRQRRICRRTDRDKRFRIATRHRHQPDPYVPRRD